MRLVVVTSLLLLVGCTKSFGKDEYTVYLEGKSIIQLKPNGDKKCDDTKKEVVKKANLAIQDMEKELAVNNTPEVETSSERYARESAKGQIAGTKQSMVENKFKEQIETHLVASGCMKPSTAAADEAAMRKERAAENDYLVLIGGAKMSYDAKAYDHCLNYLKDIKKPTAESNELLEKCKNKMPSSK